MVSVSEGQKVETRDGETRKRRREAIRDKKRHKEKKEKDKKRRKMKMKSQPNYLPCLAVFEMQLHPGASEAIVVSCCSC